MLMYRLADRLGKTVAEIGAMSVREYQGWFAYFEILESERRT